MTLTVGQVLRPRSPGVAAVVCSVLALLATTSASPHSASGVVAVFGVLSSAGRFEHVPFRFGRQFVHGCPAFTHAQLLHLPLPLHRQHEGGIVNHELWAKGSLCHLLQSA